jgi:SAM-dependent methyltransferase
MDPKIQAHLLEINQAFYQQHSMSFSATRQQVQPGVRQVVQNILPNASIIDVGCGNGTLSRHLAAHRFSGNYHGIDLSEGLLADARLLLKESPLGTYTFQKIDLSETDWAKSIQPKDNDWLVAFAVLHHLPGVDLRKQTVQVFKELIAPDGLVAISVWQWHNSSRLRQRVLPWSTIGVDPNAVEDGDVLLDWRAGISPGLRYVHTFNEVSLSKLAIDTGFEVCETFYSDGKMGNLALYQIWRLVKK